MKPCHVITAAILLLVASARARDQAALAVGRETLTEAECKMVVQRVEAMNKYTEESITPVCRELAASPKCDFFSEALSLASSHPDFKASLFCRDIADAHFCSETMDVLLSSPAMADLMLGECMRSKDKEGLNHCSKLSKILAYAIHNDDLDTMRTCYMIQAYGDLDSANLKAVAWPKEKTNETIMAEPDSGVPSPEKRIIRSSSTNPNDVGKGKAGKGPARAAPAAPAAASVGESGIVLRPKPLSKVGNGSGDASPAPAPPAPPPSAPVVLRPMPLDDLGKGEPAANKTEESEAPIIVEPEPVSAVLRNASGTKDTITIISKQQPSSTKVTGSPIIVEPQSISAEQANASATKGTITIISKQQPSSTKVTDFGVGEPATNQSASPIIVEPQSPSAEHPNASATKDAITILSKPQARAAAQQPITILSDKRPSPGAGATAVPVRPRQVDLPMAALLNIK